MIYTENTAVAISVKVAIATSTTTTTTTATTWWLSSSYHKNVVATASITYVLCSKAGATFIVHAQHSTAQHSTTQHSKTHHSTAQLMVMLMLALTYFGNHYAAQP